MCPKIIIFVELLIKNEDSEHYNSAASSTVAAPSTPLPLMEIVEFPANTLANHDYKNGKKKSKPTFLFKNSDNKSAQFEPEFQGKLFFFFLELQTDNRIKLY